MQHFREEKRAVYRTTPNSDDILTVTLEGTDGAPVSGEVSVVSSLGIEIIVPKENAPALGLGEQIVLTLNSPDLSTPLEELSEVVSRTELENERKYAFRFDHQVVLRNPALQRLFNRRVSLRISPKEVIEVTLRDPGSDHTQPLAVAQCSDISMTGIRLRSKAGISIMKAMELDQALKHLDHVEVSLDLPGSLRTQTFIAEIISRSLREDMHEDIFEYGLRFDHERTNDFAYQQEETIKYMMRCQEEELVELAQIHTLTELIRTRSDTL